MKTSFWEGRRVLVTGAGGFIGSHLTEKLTLRGADVRAFVRYNSRNDHGWLESLSPAVLESVEVFRGDLANPEAVARAAAGREIVLHLGALIPIPYSYRHAREFVDVNVTGTLNLLEAARRSDLSRIVHTSTSEVYGTPVTTPISESHPLQAQSPYAATKIAADQLALSYHRSFDLPIVVARPFNTFGPRQSARAVIPTIIIQALAGVDVRLGTTSTSRDFAYVSDTVDGLIRCAEVPGIESSVINLGTGTDTSIDDVAKLAFGIIGGDARISYDPQRARPPKSEIGRLIADVSNAHRLLDWNPTVGIREGLERTIEWFAGRLPAYKPLVYNT